MPAVGERGGRGVAAGGVAAGQQQAGGAGRGERLGDGAADALRRAGDERDLAVDAGLHAVSSLERSFYFRQHGTKLPASQSGRSRRAPRDDRVDQRHADGERGGERAEAGELGLDDLDAGVGERHQRAEGAVGDRGDAGVAVARHGDEVGGDRVVGAEADGEDGVARADAADLVERGRADVVDEHVLHALLRQRQRDVGGDREGALAADDVDQLGLGQQGGGRARRRAASKSVADAGERGLRGGDEAVEEAQVGAGAGGALPRLGPGALDVLP